MWEMSRRELVAAVVGVPANDDGPTESSGAEPETELGNVVEKYTDVCRTRAQQLVGEPGTDPRFADDVCPRPRKVARQQSGTFVLGPRSQHLRYGFHRHPCVSGVL